MSTKKFETFKPTDIKSDDIYLKNYIDGYKPDRNVKDINIDKDKLGQLNLIKQKIKQISWKDLKVKKSGSAFSNFTVYFELPENIIEDLKQLDFDFYKNTLGSKKLEIEVKSSNHNRIHIEPIPEFLRGLGLGFKMYKAIVKRLGYISTFSDSSPSAKNIWKYLIQDPSFYVIIVDAGILLINKNYDKFKIEDEVLSYLRDYYGMNISDKIDKNVIDKIYLNKHRIKIDPELTKFLKHLNLSKIDADVLKRYDDIKTKKDSN